MKPVTSMMSLLSEMMVKVQCSHWKVKVGGQLVSSKMTRDAQACLLEYEELLLHKEDAKGKQSILKKQFGGKSTCWKVICFQKPRCITITVIGNIPVSELMQPNCRDWCPATTLGMFFWVWFDLWRLLRETVSMCHAVYWKWYCFKQ